MTRPSAMRVCLVVAALNFWAFSAQSAPPPPAPAGGDAEAQKLVTAAMEVDYLKMNFDAAKKKLSQAALICRRKGCATGLHASIHGYFAVIHWMGEDSKEFAHEDLKNMLKIDVEQKLDARYSTEELEEEWEAKQVEMRKVVAEEKRAQAAREAEERKAQAAREAEERRLAAVKVAQDAAKAEEERKAAAAKAEADRKEAARKAEEDKKIAFAKQVEERKAAAAKQAELNKQQAIKDAEEKLARDAAKHAEDERLAVEAQKAEAAKRAAEDAKRAADEKKEAQRKAEEDKKRLEMDRKEAAKRDAEEKKEAAKRAEEDKRETAKRAAEDAKRVADEKKAAALKAAEDAKRSTEEKREAARKADEEKKAAALKTADEKREAAKKAEEERKEAARKAEEDKKEAARRAIEEKKEATLKAADDAKKAADEKKAAALKAADDAKKAEEDRRMRVPPPVGKLVENPFKEQAVGYPIPIMVKIPPAPPKIEKPRVEVVKVVAEYSAPGFAEPRQIELKPGKEGAWIGEIPCDVTAKDGEVTYVAAAFNKYDNAVARSGSTTKPNKVTVKSDLVSALPHWPGELPPESCAETQSKAKAAAQAKCATTEQGCNAAPPPLCEGSECGNDEVPAALAANQPKHFGCVSCRIGAAPEEPAWVPAGWLALAVGFGYRASARRRGRRSTVR